MRKWAWSTGTWHERANMVRRHAMGNKSLPFDRLRKLFMLNENGLDSILRGDDWHPEYEEDSVNYIEGKTSHGK